MKEHQLQSSHCQQKQPSIKLESNIKNHKGYFVVSENFLFSNSLMPKIILLTAAIFIIIAGVRVASHIITPFLIALFLSIIFSPLVKKLYFYKVPTGISILAIFSVIFLGVFLIGQLILSAIVEFRDSLYIYQEIVSQKFLTINKFFNKFNLDFSLFKEILIEKIQSKEAIGIYSKILLDSTNLFGQFLLVMFLVLFMLLDYPYVEYRLKNTFKEGNLSKVQTILQSINSYLTVKFTTSLITAALVWVLLIVCNVQFAVLWAVLTFCLNFIPNIGAIIATGLVLIQVLLFNTNSEILLVFGGLLIINLVIGSLIEPKLLGDKVGLSIITIFLSLIFWSWLLGITGALLAVPLTVIIKLMLESNKTTKGLSFLISSPELLAKNK